MLPGERDIAQDDRDQVVIMGGKRRSSKGFMVFKRALPRRLQSGLIEIADEIAAELNNVAAALGIPLTLNEHGLLHGRHRMGRDNRCFVSGVQGVQVCPREIDRGKVGRGRDP